MAVVLPNHLMIHPRPPKRRRTATTVMAGYFDYIPPRDVLTSLLNGVGPNKEVEGDEEARKLKKKKDSRKDKRRESSARRDSLLDPILSDATHIASTSSNPPPPVAHPQPKKRDFWAAHPQRPNIQIMTMERSVSVTPPPGYSPVNIPSASTTPGPSMSSSTSRTSSKRPRTPDDDEFEIGELQVGVSPPPEPKPRKKRKAHKKGWKGWVEGSPQPSSKLINLDSAPVLHERRTRSGKNFDAISVGKEGWV